MYTPNYSNIICGSFVLLEKAILIEPLKALLYLDMSDCQPRVVLTMAVVTSCVGADSDQFKQ